MASTSAVAMRLQTSVEPLNWPVLAWCTVVLTGMIAPALAIVLIVRAADTSSFAASIGPILAIGMMGAGMIGAAAAGRLSAGILFAVLAGTGLLCLAWVASGFTPFSAILIGVSVFIAGLSFAARGLLFACSASGKGWWIAVAVLAGEAAILLTAMAQPNALPDWLLVLLPAQWANMALRAALTGGALSNALWPLIALAGTAAATLFLVQLWPRRWTYIVMFSTWLSLSALVYHQAVLPVS